MDDVEKQKYREALRAHLTHMGWSQEELDWADENPYIRQAERSFEAGWNAAMGCGV
jgi:hypothetical protein